MTKSEETGTTVTTDLPNGGTLTRPVDSKVKPLSSYEEAMISQREWDENQPKLLSVDESFTPSHLVIGGRGLIGTAVVNELAKRGCKYVATTRSRPLRDNEIRFNLMETSIGLNDEAVTSHIDTIYLIAASSGFAACEGNAFSWHINVDANITLMRRFSCAFPVFISSDAIEWAGGTAYARQKAQVEAYVQAIDGAIIRPCRVVPARAPELAQTIVEVALERRVGLTRWA